MCREVGNSDEDVSTSEDEEKPQIAEVPDLLHPTDHHGPHSTDQPPPGAGDHATPGATDQPPPSSTDNATPGANDQHPSLVTDQAGAPTGTGLGSRRERRPRARPRKPKPARGWTVEGRSAASEQPSSMLSPTTLRYKTYRINSHLINYYH